jgi:FecR protein
MKRNGLRAGRRAWLRSAAAAGLVVAGMAQLRVALAAGTLPPGVAQIKGDVRINGKPAERGQRVGPGDVIVTGKGAELVMVVEKDAFLVRANSRVEFGSAAAGAVTALRLVTGALLSVFESGRRREIRTTTATIGIRGTGIYIEAEAMRTYACTCYGEAVLTPVADPQYAETVRTKHHDQPRYIYGTGMPRMLEAAPVVNHTDIELQMLEALVGRQLPFDPKIY